MVSVGPANRRDEAVLGRLLWLLRIALGWFRAARPGAIQGDRGYGFPWSIALLVAWGFRSLLAERGRPHGSGLGRTRYVVERSHSWFTRFRRLVQCYERRTEHAQGLHVLAACVVCARRLRDRPPATPAARAA